MKVKFRPCFSRLSHLAVARQVIAQGCLSGHCFERAKVLKKNFLSDPKVFCILTDEEKEWNRKTRHVAGMHTLAGTQ